MPPNNCCAVAKPDDLAIVNDHGRWTYGQLDETSGKIARLLVDDMA